MLIDALDIVAEKYIPEGKHKYLHVDSREAWVEVVVYLLDNKLVNQDMTSIKALAINWETLLVKRYSALN